MATRNAANHSRRSRRSRQEADIPELNVTPFMNLMIVLVPVLLLSLVFTHTTVIQLDFPAATGDASESQQHLEISILADELVVADHRGVLKRLPKVAGAHDFAGLNQVMFSAKQQMPDKRDALILLQPDTDYQALVFVMDNVRAYENLELFPNMSLGDVPVVQTGGAS
jgi:biopolymer transport protein ExbD